jgi:hypothetical protein
VDRKRLLTAVIGIVMPVALILTAGPRTPAALALGAGTSTPQVFAGTVLTAAGTPAKGAVIQLYARTGKTGPATLIGTAMTSATGRWSFAAPAYAALPKAARGAAAANMGYLNVEVIAISGSSVAVAVESAWVGTATSSNETGGSQPTAMRMRLEPSKGPALPVDCCGGRDGCVADQNGVLGHSHSYTVVGEYHAYWDAFGGLSYTKGASTEIGAYASVSKGPYSFTGWDTFSTSRSWSAGYANNGPYDSHRMVVSMGYVMTSWVLQNADSGQTCKTWDQVDEDGIYNPGHGWFVFKKGANVINRDGLANLQWENRHHPAYVNRVDATGGFQLDTGRALTYGASADVWGITIEATTSHSTDVQQTYTAGSSRARDHWVWGNDGPYTSDPQVAYSY